MFEKGTIIQYYRQKMVLTQEELSQGICSNTHLSKLERGLTEVSDETISLLCERLGFSMEEEFEKITNAKIMLDKLLKRLIFQDLDKAKEIIDSLEKEEIFYIKPLHIQFLILKVRLYLLNNQIEEAKKILHSKELRNRKLEMAEENLLNHTIGIYYIKKFELHKSIEYLNKVSLESYNNLEIHYHLALAYCHLNANISSFSHCQKAKEFFIQTNNYQRLVDTETILLALLEEETHLQFNEIESRYENLIDSVLLNNDTTRATGMIHNFAYQQYKFKKYKSAAIYYKRALELAPKEGEEVNYLTTIFGYMRCLFEGGLAETNELKQIIKEGLELAISQKNEFHTKLFKIYSYKLSNDERRYYNYLKEIALPYIFEIKNKEYFDPLATEYMHYLIENNNTSELMEFLTRYPLHIKMEDYLLKTI